MSTTGLDPALAGMLSSLKDIQEPAAIGWWPPAPGWWALAIMGVGSLIALMFYLWRRWRKHRWYRQARAHLQAIESRFARSGDPHDFMHHLIALSKSVARHQGTAGVLGYSAAQWIQYLATHYPACGFTTEDAAVAEDLLYKPPGAPLTDARRDQLRQWPTKFGRWLNQMK